MEGEALLDHVLENMPPLEPLRVEPELCQEEVSSTEIELTPSLERPSPKPEDLKDGFQPTDLPYFEDDLFDDIGAPRSMFKKKHQIRVAPTVSQGF